MRYCDHEFHKINAGFDGQTNTGHATLGCIWCGQIRKIDTQGDVEVLISEGHVKQASPKDVPKHS